MNDPARRLHRPRRPRRTPQRWPLPRRDRRTGCRRVLTAIAFGASAALLTFGVLLLILPAVTA